MVSIKPGTRESSSSTWPRAASRRRPGPASPLEWINARENLSLIGPGGTGKSHALIALGNAAVHTGLRVRYFTAAELVENLYRRLAGNSVGKVIKTLLRHDLIICDEVGFAPLNSTGSQLLFRFVAAAYKRRSLAIASHWPFEEWCPRTTSRVVLRTT